MAVRQLAAVPLLIYFWGAEYYGEWLVLSAVPAFMSMSNLGIGTAASIRVSHDIAAGELQKAWETLAAATIFIVAVLSFVWLIFAVTICSVPWLTVGFNEISNPSGTLVMLSGSALSRLVPAVASGWWIGVGRPAAPTHLKNFLLLSELALVFTVPMCGGSAFLLASLLLVATLLWGLLFALLTVIEVGKYSVCRRLLKLNFGEIVGLIGTGVGHQLSVLWQALLFQGSILVAASFLGPLGAALWGSLRIMIRSVNQLMEVVSQGVSPEFQRAHGSKDLAKLRGLYAVSLAIAIVVSVLSVGVLGFWGRQVFAIWTNYAFHVPVIAWWVFVVSSVPFSLWWVSSVVDRTANRPWFINLAGVGSAIVALGVMSSSYLLGVTGMSLGALTFDVLMAFLVFPRACRVLGQRPIEVLMLGFRLLTTKTQGLALGQSS